LFFCRYRHGISGSPITQPLRSERLTLRAATAADAARTFEYRRLQEVGEWITEIPADFDAYNASFTEPTRLALAVIVELDGVTIGDFLLRVEDAWAQKEVAEQARGRQAEIGYVLDPAYAGRGYATEAVRELLRYCFEDLDVHRVVANCFTDNVTSWRLMERVGMRREAHTVRDSLHRSGQWLDSYAYALLAYEWRASA
jgi:RimJ/RimL family protein N-acetyltransferase